MKTFRQGGSYLGGKMAVIEGDGPPAKAYRAAHGTCQACGRYVETWTREGETARKAVTHSAWRKVFGSVEREWDTCPGSGRAIK